jgi:hypothetical protein
MSSAVAIAYYEHKNAVQEGREADPLNQGEAWLALYEALHADWFENWGTSGRKLSAGVIADYAEDAGLLYLARLWRVRAADTP